MEDMEEGRDGLMKEDGKILIRSIRNLGNVLCGLIPSEMSCIICTKGFRVQSLGFGVWAETSWILVTKGQNRCLLKILIFLQVFDTNHTVISSRDFLVCTKNVRGCKHHTRSSRTCRTSRNCMCPAPASSAINLGESPTASYQAL